MSSVTINITREPFMPTCVITLPNGQSEEMEAEQARLWFKMRGANMDVVEQALDDIWSLPASDSSKFGQYDFVGKVGNTLMFADADNLPHRTIYEANVEIENYREVKLPPSRIAPKI